MNTPTQSANQHSNAGLWVTVVVEALMIVAIGAYNIYEVRRHSKLVQAKIEKLAQDSAHQGEKVDQMMNALELYVGKKFDAGSASTNSPASEERIDKAIEFLQTLKQKEKRD